MDPNEKGEEMVHEEIINIVNDQKCCVDCKTTKTPLWRSGPAGPKSLCNACGIRYRKKRVCITAEDLIKDQEKKKTKDQKETSNKRRRVSEDLRRRVMALGKEVVLLQRSRSPVKRQRRSSNHNWKKMGEVEQAAVLLMALSCGSILPKMERGKDGHYVP